MNKNIVEILILIIIGVLLYKSYLKTENISIQNKKILKQYDMSLINDKNKQDTGRYKLKNVEYESRTNIVGGNVYNPENKLWLIDTVTGKCLEYEMFLDKEGKSYAKWDEVLFDYRSQKYSNKQLD